MRVIVVCVFVLAVAGRVAGQDLIGATLLQSQTTNLNASGVRVAQVEADYEATGDFEVEPSFPFLNQPTNLFEWIGGTTPLFPSTSTNYPNSVGGESDHAGYVARQFYGFGYFEAVATNVAHVDNYEASAFVSGNAVSVTLVSANINDPVVNQSFIASGATTSEQEKYDTAYDNYAVEYNTLFVSAVGDSGGVSPPSTCYNGLGVGNMGGQTSTGPTPDNGRAKPDLVAVNQNTSLSTPEVAGAAAVLIQAGLRGDGGANTNAAVAICTLKALLINGAIKPPGWTNVSPSPLSTTYGAGVLNVFESYKQLAGGMHGFGATSSVATGSAHPPTGATTTVPGLSGWDYATNTSSSSDDVINHYYFNVTNGVAGAKFNATATLAWNRHENETAINNLKLYLYNTANSNLVGASISTVDNVQHVWVPQLPAGRYDLQVWKAGGSGIVSDAEPYALAYEFVDPALSISKSTGGFTVSWPVYPTGYMLASATNLLTPVASWNTNYAAPAVNGSQNQLTLGTTNVPEFFMLTRP